MRNLFTHWELGNITLILKIQFSNTSLSQIYKMFLLKCSEVCSWRSNSSEGFSVLKPLRHTVYGKQACNRWWTIQPKKLTKSSLPHLCESQLVPIVIVHPGQRSLRREHCDDPTEPAGKICKMSDCYRAVMLSKIRPAFLAGLIIFLVKSLFHWSRVMHIYVIELDYHWFMQWLVAYSAPSHYLNQWWLIVNWTLRNKVQWNF